ncbi:hypothetical protein [Pseudokineococcus sp. 1T1Z-3]|uniref:hypothetical protein n=1 Tax=Pseudokineococcus sp. 1T1Z-3 TaxID=3132745 RepID=UPI0030B54A4B
MTLLGLAAALAAMLANTAATLLEAAGSRRASADRPVWRQPAYLLGLALDGVGWVLAVVALRFLPVVAVQSVLTSTVALTTLAAHRFDVRRVPRAQLVAVGGVVLGLVLVAASAAPGRPAALPSAAVPVLVASALVLAALALPVLRSGRPLLMAAVAGAAYGGTALSVRALHITSDLAEDMRLLTQPLTYALVVMSVVGVLLVAAALREGAPGTVTAVLSVTEVLLPGLAGLALLGDGVRPGWAPALAVGVAVLVASVLVLARPEVDRRRVPV